MTLRLSILALIFALAACGEKPADEKMDTTQTATTSPPATPVSEPHTIARSPSTEGASVFFITPEDGATVTNPINIEFGIAGMNVVKAGNNQPHSGHHHLLIDTDLPDLGMPIPADEQHVHFGDGSTSTQISLLPGEHKLQMLLGDYLHIPHNPPLTSAQITITVE
jgi:hypothetical protein